MPGLSKKVPSIHSPTLLLTQEWHTDEPNHAPVCLRGCDANHFCLESNSQRSSGKLLLKGDRQRDRRGDERRKAG